MPSELTELLPYLSYHTAPNCQWALNICYFLFLLTFKMNWKGTRDFLQASAEREHPYWGQGGMRARQMPLVSEREQMYISQHRQRRGGQVADCSLLRDMAVMAQLLTTSWFDSGSLNSCISSCTTLWDQHQGGVCVCVRACSSKGTKMAFHMSI